MDEVKYLIAKEIPRLRRYAFALVHDTERADDLVQDCLERAIRKRSLWKRHGSIRNWLYRILYNTFLNQATHRKRAASHVSLDKLSAPLSQPPQQEKQIMFDDIAMAMGNLPDEQRAAILLTAVEELSYDEAAHVLGVSIGTVRSRISRGRERLRSLYAEKAAGSNLRRVK